MSDPEEVFIEDMSSDSVLMLEVITESGGVCVTSRSVSAWGVVVNTTELIAPRNVEDVGSVREVMVVSVGSVTGWAEGLVFVPVDVSGETMDRPGSIVLV